MKRPSHHYKRGQLENRQPKQQVRERYRHFLKPHQLPHWQLSWQPKQR
ncbi:hypothetical protein [Lentilactobacillus parafarraginis]|nr:hypothetical protein [Lentilactobacillus parafarraginis]